MVILVVFKAFLLVKNLEVLIQIVQDSPIYYYSQSAQISQKQDERNIYEIMKTMLRPGYHHNGFVATHASVRFEHSVLHGSLMTTYITLLALLVEHSLVHWYQQCVTVHHVPKWMSCHKAIVVITGRAHCFHDFIYITLILLL